MLARVAVLLAIAAAVGSLANAVSPRGLSWTHPMGRGLRAKLLDAGLAPVDVARLPDLLRGRRLRLIDARAAEEFRTGRIAGAASFPWKDVEAGTLPLPPPDGPTVVYCANEFCEEALRLARRMAARGDRDVGVLVEGYDQWWSRRWPVDQD